MPIEAEHILCKQCGYALKGLTSNVCPECGRAFDPDDPDTVKIALRVTPMPPFPWKMVLLVAIGLCSIGPAIVAAIVLVRWLTQLLSR